MSAWRRHSVAFGLALLVGGHAGATPPLPAQAAAGDLLFRQGFEVGKRVRTETAIGESAVSISYAAVELAKKVFDALEGRTVLVLGAPASSNCSSKSKLLNSVSQYGHTAVFHSLIINAMLTPNNFCRLRGDG